MIPKKIHYIWFGGKPLSPMAQRCLLSWKEQCPDYEIVRWDETTFDGGGNPYFEEALQNRQWAFASDFARLKILVENGGIYMDTDVEVVRNLDAFLTLDAFAGFESASWISTGILGCKKSFPLFKQLLEEYDDRRFVKEDGSFDQTPNVVVITRAYVDRGLVLNGRRQTISGLTVYPSEFFSPKDQRTRQVNLTKNTHAIHHFDGSWLPDEVMTYKKVKESIISMHPRLPYPLASGTALVRACIEVGNMKPLQEWLNGRKRANE